MFSLSLVFTVLLLLLLFQNEKVVGSGVGNHATWVPDQINLAFGGVTFSKPWFHLNVSAYSNGPVYTNDGGHFRLHFFVSTFDYGNVIGISDCIQIGQNMMEVTSMIGNINMTSSSGKASKWVYLSSLFSVSTQKFKQKHNVVNYATTYIITMTGIEGIDLKATMSSEGCAPIRTISSWTTREKWSDKVVPNNTFAVTIPVGTGVILLPPNVTLSSLTVQGGLLLAHNTSCQPDWTPNPSGVNR